MHLSRPLAAVLLLTAVTPVVASITRSAQPFVGVTQYQVIESGQLGQPDDPLSPKLQRPAVVNVLEIDTTAPGIHFEMSPGNGAEPGEVKRQTTRSFVDSVHAQIGINVGFYDTKANYGNLNTDLMNLAASNGDVYSKPRNGNEWVFDVSKDNHPRILKADGADAATVGNGQAVYNAAGGNQPMLHDGKVVTPDDGYTHALNPHTAIGVSQDHTKIYLAVVDGRQNGYSEGLRTDELARVMQHFGAWDAINFDGGGSSTLVMDDSDDGKQDARVVNSPSDGGTPAKPGDDRIVANSFAIFATPKPGYTPLPPVPRPSMKDALELVKTRTVIDSFEDGNAGHFAGPVVAGWATRGVDKSSTATVDTRVAHDGKSSLKLTLVADKSPTTQPAGVNGWQLRLLSGNAEPKTNMIDGKAMGNDGFVGVWLRRDAGGPPLFVSLIVDEGTPTVDSTERGQSFEVKADGQWHLYQWGLNEDAKWFNYSGGNGKIDGPNVFVDSLLFGTSNDATPGPAFNGTLWMDDLTFDPSGRLDVVK